MAGKNLVIKPGQILFKQGDASNGMFLVRKGSLRVYLEKEDKKVDLAEVNQGGMISEMALFDQKPRSASVSAIDQVEVTLISNDDFAKLMKQIPKWFTALMTTLSGRLRATNERLEKIQADSAPEMQGVKSIMRILLVIDLLIHRDGEKEGKEWMLNREETLEILSINFAEDKDLLAKLLQALSEQNVILLKKNKYNAEVIATNNRGNLTRFLQFLGLYLKNALKASLDDAPLDMLKAIKSCGEHSAYESYTVSLDDLAAEGQRLKLPTVGKWKENIQTFKNLDFELKVVKTDSGLGFKTSKKAIRDILGNHETLSALAKSITG